MDDLKAIYSMYTFFWQLFKKYQNIKPGDEELWDEIIKESNTFIEQYRNNKATEKLALDLFSATVDFLEEKAKVNEEI